MALAAAAAGAHGIMLEVHDEPGAALSDGPQALDPETLPGLITHMREIAAIAARHGESPDGESPDGALPE
jgi:3-deoxy-D-arabino-heptulosonate 7-phosphate (DAHP) synthase